VTNEKPGSRQQPKRHANRTSFKPGQSGNPTGRPKHALSLVSNIRDCLERPIPPLAERRKLLPIEQLAWRWIDSAINGSDRDGAKWAMAILERLDGRVPERVELNGGVVAVRYVDDWRDPRGEDSSPASGDAGGAPPDAPDDAPPSGPAVA